MYSADTIAAISTPHGTGGIGIIRISGDRAFEIAASVFRGKNPLEEIKTHTINYGRIIDPKNGEVLDEVLLSKMKKPGTFTGEDTVEINCHGGIMVLKRVLALLVYEGVRLAEPGEFTKRAFLNGKMDLSQAEAVIDLIHSKTFESSKAAVNQLEGKLSKVLKEARDKLIELIAHIEVTVDYPEHDIEEITGQEVYEGVLKIRGMLEQITAGFEKGRILREGINAVILGRPNVGKSSLLNALSGKSRAIVTDIPGTTRDILEEYINIQGIPVRLIDTAGIRETYDVVEKIGVERAEKETENADLVIFMLDAKTGLKDEDIQILKKIAEKKVIILLNKMDLVPVEVSDNILQRLEGYITIKTSLKDESGLDKLEEEIYRLFLHGEIHTNNEVLLTNIRHKSLIEKALKSMHEALAAYEGGMPLDCITIDIKNAAEYLGQITGESVSEDVMHEIFSRFCLGK